ncbi:Z-DNA-binding protein 1/Z-DNA complex-binding [Caudoviricetes sp.]|nr:Z-DNA-binding protein 1/Z-DNA complex-binding [Caudoviricetes sp.]
MRLTRGKYRHALSAALTESSVLAMVERMGELDAEGLSYWLGYAEGTCRKYLERLERQGRLVSRRETFEEASARVAKLPKVSFVSRRGRRRIRFAIAPQTARAA